MQERLIAFAEAVTVVFPGRRGNGRVAKPGMLFDAWRQVVSDIAASGVESVVEALTRNLTECRRGSVDDNRLRVSATGNGKDGQKQCRQSKSFLHEFSSLIPIPAPRSSGGRMLEKHSVDRFVA
jgi:hypothetical protein